MWISEVPSTAEVAPLSQYPGYVAGQSVGGMVAVHPMSTGTRYTGVLTGLETRTTAGWHVHSGFTCGSQYGVGGHYYPELQADPWLATTYTSDEHGVAHVDETLVEFSLHRGRPVYGRAVVVHLSPTLGSARAGCGVIGGLTASAFPGVMASMSRYAGYGGQFEVKGILALHSVAVAARSKRTVSP